MDVCLRNLSNSTCLVCIMKKHLTSLLKFAFCVCVCEPKKGDFHGMFFLQLCHVFFSAANEKGRVNTFFTQPTTIIHEREREREREMLAANHVCVLTQQVRTREKGERERESKNVVVNIQMHEFTCEKYIYVNPHFRELIPSSSFSPPLYSIAFW